MGKGTEKGASRVVALLNGRILLCEGKLACEVRPGWLLGPRSPYGLPTPVLHGAAEQDSPRGLCPGSLSCTGGVTP